MCARVPGCSPGACFLPPWPPTTLLLSGSLRGPVPVLVWLCLGTGLNGCVSLLFVSGGGVRSSFCTGVEREPLAECRVCVGVCVVCVLCPGTCRLPGPPLHQPPSCFPDPLHSQRSELHRSQSAVFPVIDLFLCICFPCVVLAVAVLSSLFSLCSCPWLTHPAPCTRSGFPGSLWAGPDAQIPTHQLCQWALPP